MKIRAYVSTPIESWQSTNEVIKHSGKGDAHLSWGGIKGFIDGSLGSRTAWFYDEYQDQAGFYGLPINQPKVLKTWMENADRAGLRLSIHALGDRGIDTVIGQMKEIAGPDIRQRRYRLEHFQHPSQQAINDLADTGIIASMQPYHAIDDGRWAGERLSKKQLKTTYAFRSILDAGAMLSFGSDWPVAPLSPIEGVYAAVTRRTLDDANPAGWIPQQKISVEEALTAYTVTNAYSFGEEQSAGTIEVGKRADLAVLSTDPRNVKPEHIRDITVLYTLIDGQIVYSQDANKN